MPVQIPQSAGTIVSDSQSGGWLQKPAAFDGTTTQAQAACAQAANNGVSGGGVTYYIGKDWGSGVSHKVTRLVVFAPSNSGILGGPTSGSWSFDGSNDGSAWTSLDSGTTAGTTAEVLTRTSATINTTTAYRFHRFAVTGNGSNGISIAEVQFFESAVSISAAMGSFALTGVAAALHRGKMVAAGFGSFALTGIAATLVKGKWYVLAASLGLFTLTGYVATLARKIADPSKFKRRRAQPKLQKRRVNPPTLDD